MNWESQLKLQAYVDGELSAAEAREVADWLAVDTEAKAIYTELQQTGSLLEEHRTELKLPESREFYWSKIEHAILQAQQPVVSPAKPGWETWLWQYLVPVSSAALLMFLFLPFGKLPSNQASRGLKGEFDLNGGMVVETESPSSSVTYRSESEGVTIVWMNTH